MFTVSIVKRRLINVTVSIVKSRSIYVYCIYCEEQAHLFLLNLLLRKCTSMFTVSIVKKRNIYVYSIYCKEKAHLCYINCEE